MHFLHDHCAPLFCRASPPPPGCPASLCPCSPHPRRGDYTGAIERYSGALDVLVPLERLPSEGPRRAAYHTNRAAAYMARADAGNLREGALQRWVTWDRSRVVCGCNCAVLSVPLHLPCPTRCVSSLRRAPRDGAPCCRGLSFLQTACLSCDAPAPPS